MTTRKPLFYFTLFTCALAFIVIVLGAYTRLKDAGLGCPDWPGCYGQLSVPTQPTEIAEAAKLYPTLAVEAKKAWPEMIHRYFAGTLGLCIFLLSAALFYYREKLHLSRSAYTLIPLGLISLVIFQALLGMWTVTWLLLPLVVMGHLLGGLTILSLLVWSALHWYGSDRIAVLVPPIPQRYLRYAQVGLIIVFLQIALGGWTAANYAALVCPDFPYCSPGVFVPPLDIKSAFDFTSPIGANYQGGLLHYPARATIQWVHRLGAAMTLLYLCWFSIVLLRQKHPRLAQYAIFLLAILALQIVLGILNVVLLLPLSIAVSHNAVGALLLASMIFIVYQCSVAKKTDS